MRAGSVTPDPTSGPDRDPSGRPGAACRGRLPLALDAEFATITLVWPRGMVSMGV